MKVTDWMAVAEELAGGLHARDSYKNQVIAKHTREVPEGLATRLRGVLKHILININDVATPDACAALDADAEAMRVRREVEESGCFVTAGRAEGGYFVNMTVSGPHRSGAMDDAYRAAHDALRKAGKL